MTRDHELADLLRAYAGHDCPQGVLADWLEEHGDARAGQVRELCIRTVGMAGWTCWYIHPVATPPLPAYVQLGKPQPAVPDPFAAEAALRSAVLELFPEWKGWPQGTP